MTADLIPLAQAVAAPADIPEWVWFALVAVAAWFARDVWPWLRDLRSADAKARREREARGESDQEDRFLQAFETSSAAQAQTASALEKVAASLDLFARNSVAVTFELSELRREVRGRSTPDADREIVARMLRQEPGA